VEGARICDRIEQSEGQDTKGGSEMALDIIDVHVHLCRSVPQEKLVFLRAGWPDEWYWGNPEHIISYMDNWGVSHVVTQNIMDTGAMTRARLAREDNPSPARREELREEMRQRVRSFNDWACNLHAAEPRVIPFIMADPVLFGRDAAAEIERCLAMGAAGIKVHPDICGHAPGDERALPMYELCSALGIPVLTDTTGVARPNGQCFGTPSNWQPVIKQFRDMKLILAHLTGERWDEHIAVAREFGDNLFFDTSPGFVDPRHPAEQHRALPIAEGRRVLRAIGTDRILFGSDGPAAHREIADAVSQLLRLELTDEENRKILHDNAFELLGLGSRARMRAVT
jgi:predicted TIM-barrel fold metal-dependent hydrolase